MIDLDELRNELTDLFIEYQHRLDRPMPSGADSLGSMYKQYTINPIFRTKVDSLVSGVMYVVSKRVYDEGS